MGLQVKEPSPVWRGGFLGTGRKVTVQGAALSMTELLCQWRLQCWCPAGPRRNFGGRGPGMVSGEEGSWELQVRVQGLSGLERVVGLVCFKCLILCSLEIAFWVPGNGTGPLRQMPHLELHPSLQT